MSDPHIFAIMPVEAFQDRRLSLEQLRVLGALLTFRGRNTNTCWPSREALAERCGYSPKKISETTTALCHLGWLVKVGHGGRGKSSQYAITVPESVTVLDPETVPLSGTVTKSETVPESGTKRSPFRGPPIRTDQELKREVNRDPPTPQKRQSRQTGNAMFDEFWREYPRKVSKGQAETAWAKINPDELLAAQIIHKLKQAKTLDPRFREMGYTPHPASWLNAKGWMDEFGQDPAKPATSSAYAADPKPATSSAYGRKPWTPRNGADNSAAVMEAVERFNRRMNVLNGECREIE